MSHESFGECIWEKPSLKPTYYTSLIFIINHFASWWNTLSTSKASFIVDLRSFFRLFLEKVLWIGFVPCIMHYMYKINTHIQKWGIIDLKCFCHLKYYAFPRRIKVYCYINKIYFYRILSKYFIYINKYNYLTYQQSSNDNVMHSNILVHLRDYEQFRLRICLLCFKGK